jgi:hypothetical protein
MKSWRREKWLLIQVYALRGIEGLNVMQVGDLANFDGLCVVKGDGIYLTSAWRLH